MTNPSRMILASTGLQSLDYLVVLVYLIGVLGAGWYFSRSQTKTDEFFVAKRQMPWMAVGLSIIATMLSTVSYLATPGEVIRHGLALAIGWLAIPLCFVVVNFLWIPFFMRLQVTSIYEYLEPRFGLATRWLAVFLFVAILRLFWMATIVLTAARAVAQITHESILTFLPVEMTLDQWTLVVLFSVGVLSTFYTMLGGIKAVIWTDVVQCVVLFLGVVLTLSFVVARTGTGPFDWWQTTTSSEGEGHRFPAIFSFDITTRNVLLFTILHTVTWYSCTFIADQVAVQRYLTTTSVRAAIRGNVVNFVGDFFMMSLLAVCGMALLTYYLDPRFQTEIIKGVIDPRNEAVADKVFPHFIAHGLPLGISGIVVAALFAVAMSSLDSGVNSVSAVLTVDVFQRLNGMLSDRDSLRLAKMLTLIVGLGCTLLAWGMSLLPEHYNIIGITARTFNCALGPLASLFFVGMFFRHVGQRAVIIGAITGLVTAVSSAWWVELRWILGLTKYLQLSDAVNHLSGPTPFLITPLAVVVSVGLSWIMGFIFPCTNPDEVDKLLWRSLARREES